MHINESAFLGEFYYYITFISHMCETKIIILNMMILIGLKVKRTSKMGEGPGYPVVDAGMRQLNETDICMSTLSGNFLNRMLGYH